MALFLAQANLNIVGQQILWGNEYDLPPGDGEVMDCVAAGYLWPRREDGSYASPPPPAVRSCCGSR